MNASAKSATVFLFGGGLEKNKKGVWESTRSLGALLRVEASALLAKEDPMRTIIASGGKGTLSHIPDAPTVCAVMKRELVERGVPASRIIEESRSNNTYEELIELERLFKTGKLKSVVLLSNEWHLPRIQAFVTYAPKLSYLRRAPITFLSAEAVLEDRDAPHWRPVIRSVYDTKEMAELIVSEKRGIRQIRAGSYDYDQVYRKTLTVGSHTFGRSRPFIVAEVSCNHAGSYKNAEALVRAAAAAGADAAKLQAYTPDTMTVDSDAEWFRVGGGGNPGEWNGKTLYRLYQEAQTPWEWHKPLQKLAKQLGIEFFSTAFDPTAVDYLEKLGVPCHKVAAYEANDLPLLKRVGKTGKPVIMSIGFLTLQELKLSVKTLREAGCTDLVLLHSTGSYARRSKAAAMNLGVIPDLWKRFGAVAGFSDNTGGIEAPVLAVAAGAAVIEKHIVLRHDPKILDDQFSLDPKEFKAMVMKIRAGDTKPPKLLPPKYGPQTKEEKHNLRYRRSLFVVEDMRKGERFTEKNVRPIRPNFGLKVSDIYRVFGRRAKTDIKKATPLSWRLIA